MPRKRLPDRKRKSRLTIAQILAWADEYHRRRGAWPYTDAGPIHGTADETWCGVNFALYRGRRGLKGKSSLAILLERHRGVAVRRNALDEDTIFQWAEAHYRRTGKWPTRLDGVIHDLSNETWGAVDEALRDGRRSLSGGSTLRKLLKKHGIRHKNYRKITPEQILQWADQFYSENGHWPYPDSGTIRDSPENSWSAIEIALRLGNRGFPGGSSLSKFLNEHRGIFGKLKKRPHRILPERRLDLDRIMVWAKITGDGRANGRRFFPDRSVIQTV